jgi:undecaprenyl-diphosphatase
MNGIAMETLSSWRQRFFEPDSADPARSDNEPHRGLGAKTTSRAMAFRAVGGLGIRLAAAELHVVRAAARTATSPVPASLAIIFSKLGNGWVYPLLGAVILIKWGLFGLRIIAPAAVSALLLHSFYPVMKRAFCRRRPFQAAPELRSLLDALDAHSFPSGHTMTLAAVLTPVVMLWPATTLWAVTMGVCVAWSRLATAHHYPSDVLAGAVLGIGVGYPATACLASVWGVT